MAQAPSSVTHEPTAQPAVSVSLSTMRSLTYAKDPSDDWTGITARDERKRRQNKLNQRARRRRKADEMTTTLKAGNDSLSNSAQYKRSAISIFEAEHRDFSFPVSTDHLILLVQYNVYRACLSNMKQLQVSTPWGFIVSTPKSNTPPTLTPTLLQRCVKHAAWIDAVPNPILRDNCIRQHGKYDSDAFWNDIVGDLHESFDSPPGTFKGQKNFGHEFAGLICWSDPWDISGWEVTPKCYHKWQRLFKGCVVLIQNTNRRRIARGEWPLRVDLQDAFEDV